MIISELTPSIALKKTRSPIHVVVGVVYDNAGRVLITKRKQKSHLAGLWEFPGGKVERNESEEEALRRELKEEVGIDICGIEPLITVPHSYSEKDVLLHVYRVSKFNGSASGLEGQEAKWIEHSDLPNYSFPEANKAIITALNIPRELAITGEFENECSFHEKIYRVAGMTRLIQIRAPWLDQKTYIDMFLRAKSYLHERGHLSTCLFANGPEGVCPPSVSQHVHLPSKILKKLCEENWGQKSSSDYTYISASCHSLEELDYALGLGVSFVFFSPVKATLSHPNTPPMGWANLEAFCMHAPIPVYSLGGMVREDLSRARLAGAHGIAAISEYWR